MLPCTRKFAIGNRPRAALPLPRRKATWELELAAGAVAPLVLGPLPTVAAAVRDRQYLQRYEILSAAFA
jgi:hypothetical protein